MTEQEELAAVREFANQETALKEAAQAKVIEHIEEITKLRNQLQICKQQFSANEIPTNVGALKEVFGG